MAPGGEVEEPAENHGPGGVRRGSGGRQHGARGGRGLQTAPAGGIQQHVPGHPSTHRGNGRQLYVSTNTLN